MCLLFKRTLCPAPPLSPTQTLTPTALSASIHSQTLPLQRWQQSLVHFNTHIHLFSNDSELEAVADDKATTLSIALHLCHLSCRLQWTCHEFPSAVNNVAPCAELKLPSSLIPKLINHLLVWFYGLSDLCRYLSSVSLQ